MKKFQIGWVFVLAILFSACGLTVTQQYLSQQGHWQPVRDSAGKIVANEMAYDTLLKIEPGFSQKVTIAKHDGTGIVAVLLLILAIGLIVYGIRYGNNAGKWTGLPVILFCAAILVCCGAFATINWAATKEVEIPKVLYDSLQHTPDGVEKYVDQQILK
jgi:hypothetical protein